MASNDKQIFFSPDGVTTGINEINDCKAKLKKCNAGVKSCFEKMNSLLSEMGKGGSNVVNFDDEISRMENVTNNLNNALDDFNQKVNKIENNATDYAQSIGLSTLSTSATTSRVKTSSYSSSSNYSASYSDNESSSSSSSSSSNNSSNSSSNPFTVTSKKTDYYSSTWTSQITGPTDEMPESGWWLDNSGNVRCIDPETHQPIKSCTRVDPYASDEYGAIYDFDENGVATWHLPTVDDLPNGAYGSGAEVPNITQGDRRQRVLLYALSRLGCSYATGNVPTEFVCDGLSGWSYLRGTHELCATSNPYGFSEDGNDYYDASCQWDLIKTRNGDPWKADINSLKPGDIVFFGQEAVTYGPGSIDYNGEAYHAGIYYGNGLMINARSNGEGVQFTDISWYNDNMMTYLGGGSPYAEETSYVEIPHY